MLAITHYAGRPIEEIAQTFPRHRKPSMLLSKALQVAYVPSNSLLGKPSGEPYKVASTDVLADNIADMREDRG